jgi:hypothetical protein
MEYSVGMADSSTHDFDWVLAQSGCTTELMFKALLEGARKDVDRRNAVGFGRKDGWRFELHVEDDDNFEVTRIAGSSAASAFVTFERAGPRIHVAGDGVDIEMTAIVSINPSGDCRYFVGENEYLGWEIRKLALDTLFFERQDE